MNTKYHALSILNQAFGRKHGKEGLIPREEALAKDRQTILAGWNSTKDSNWPSGVKNLSPSTRFPTG